MENRNSSVSEIRERIRQADHIAVFAHVSPDGDSIGSVLGLGWALQDAGKTVTFVSQDPVPPELHFLFQYCGGENPFVSEPADDTDCFITPDISSVDRAGSYFEKHPEKQPDIEFDHHVSNTYYGKLNWVSPLSPATADVITGLLESLGLQFSQRIAAALLTGIVTDTIGFTTSNVNAEVFAHTSKLVQLGADPFFITQKALKEREFSAGKLWGYGIEKMVREDGIIWSTLTIADREAAGYPGNDDANFVNFLADNKDTKVAVLFVEKKPGELKVSWRSKPGYPVHEVALSFGGGGHAPAAGATIRGSLEEVIPRVLSETKRISLGL